MTAQDLYSVDDLVNAHRSGSHVELCGVVEEAVEIVEEFGSQDAVETLIWLTEVAPQTGKVGQTFLEHLANANNDANPELMRLALKLATGAGKTTVMAMIVAWQTVNAQRHPNSRRFTRGFLIVAPGLTIKDRLRVLQPNDPDSYYASRELVPGDMLEDLHRAKIVITNYHEKLGRIPVLKARMNADLHMAEDLKNTGKGNLSVIFGEPDIDILDAGAGQVQVKVNGVDVFHPNTGEVRSDGADGIACWFVDTDPAHPGLSLHRIEQGSDMRTQSGRIAVKEINHLGDE